MVYEKNEVYSVQYNYEEVPKKDKQEKESVVSFAVGNYWLQIAAVISVNLAAIGASTTWFWTSPALPYLKSNISEIPTTDSEGIWLASILDISASIGLLLCPLSLQVTGRKLSLLILGVFHAISWIMVIFSKNIETLYTARFIAGLSYQMSFKIQIIYIAEISDKNIRGTLVSTVKIFSCLGQLFVKSAGAFLSFRNMNIAMLSTPLLFLFTFAFVPESPYYLLIRGKIRKAWESISKLKGTKNPQIVESALEEIQESVKDAQKIKAFCFRELVYIQGNRRSLYIVLIAVATASLSGRAVMTSFTQEVLGYSDLPLSPEYATLIVAGIALFISVLITPFIDRGGRKTVFFLSGILSTICLALLGLTFFMKYYMKTAIPFFTWMPLICFVLYFVTLEDGIVNLTDILMSEMFALEVKGMGLIFIGLAKNLFWFITHFSFGWLNSTFGIYTTFWIYAVFCLTGTIMFIIVAPETRGKSLEEIQDILHERRKLKEDDLIDV
ncbi:facilitated trehalose transporter Tret1-like [Belonocnema kinseyi]|uniref:facilitated trehalose transporter Tret1-like n=1 Tax=Belonocnema kinseyi TaxID=2817044 RepID=UPI00143CE9F0|nr:facilitated trehalose transporter Tret1-like [Belonocnema kinseyi]